MHRKVLASSHQHLMAEAPIDLSALYPRLGYGSKRFLFQLAAKKLVADQIAKTFTLRNPISCRRFGGLTCARAEKKHRALFLDRVY